MLSGVKPAEGSATCGLCANTAPVLMDFSITFVIVTSPYDFKSKFLIVFVFSVIDPVSKNFVSGVTFFESIPADIVITLIIEPGSYIDSTAGFRNLSRSNSP